MAHALGIIITKSGSAKIIIMLYREINLFALAMPLENDEFSSIYDDRYGTSFYASCSVIYYFFVILVTCMLLFFSFKSINIVLYKCVVMDI